MKPCSILLLYPSRAYYSTVARRLIIGVLGFVVGVALTILFYSI